MIHRLHNRNTGYGNNLTNTLANNQKALNATEGATALNINNSIEQNTNVQSETEQEKINKFINEPSIENISMENAAYLHNTENVFNENDSKTNKNLPTFEVDSIELVTPELFDDNEVNNSFNQDNNSEKEPEIFENQKTEEEAIAKEPEMFEESNLEEDFEIPAFLRRQKN